MKEEKRKLVKVLCEIHLENDRKSHVIGNILRDNKQFLGNLDPVFIYEILHMDKLGDLILDLLGVPEESDSYSRDFCSMVWNDHVEMSVSEGLSSVAESYIDTIIKEVVEEVS